jgi:hypothetical protein
MKDVFAGYDEHIYSSRTPTPRRGMLGPLIWYLYKKESCGFFEAGKRFVVRLGP